MNVKTYVKEYVIYISITYITYNICVFNFDEYIYDI